MILKLFKNPLFLIGFVFIVLLLLSSFAYTLYFYEPHVPNELIFNNDGDLIGHHPLPPSFDHIFGTDYKGYDIFTKVIDGAKYTIGFALAISLIRMVLSIIFGSILATYFNRLKFILKHFSDAFHYTPAVLVIYVLASPFIVIYSWNFEESTKTILLFCVITAVALPALTFSIASEIEQVRKQEFIESAKLLGGGRFHILKRHVGPYLNPRLLIIYGQQIVQVLIIFAHLAVLGLYMGGTTEKVEITVNIDGGIKDALQSTTNTNEWGGLIADNKDEIFAAFRWMILPPVIALSITILAMVFMVEGMKAVLLEKKPPKKKQRKALIKVNSPPEMGFEFINKHNDFSV